MTSLLKHIKPFHQCARTISNLYVSRHKASENCIILKPFIDFNLELHRQSLEARKLKFDIVDLNRQWDMYKELERHLTKLEFKKNELAAGLSSMLKKRGNREKSKEIDALVEIGKMIRTDIKRVKEALWTMEEVVVCKTLHLPNSVHLLTPFEEPEIFMSHNSKSQEESACHLDTGKRLNLLEFISPHMYFLKGKAAEMELNVMDFISKELSDFILFSNSDFVRSIVVEGCVVDPWDIYDTFVLNQADKETNRLHLTGGASLMSFMAFLSKNIVFPTLLPLKYLSIGRKYSPSNPDSDSNLYNVDQTTSAEIFIATKDFESSEIEFQNLLIDIIDLYKKFDCHFRALFVVAPDLKFHESLRIDLQMFSPYLNDYVTTGSLSICNTFLSEKLLFQCMEGERRVFPHVISGTVLNYSTFLACLLEQKKWNENDEIFPKCCQV